MKKLLIALGLIVLLLVVAALIVPFLIPTERYKEEISAQVRASTGRDFVIEGPLSFSLLPGLALSAEDVRFANRPDGVEPVMASLEELRLSVKLLPLLSGTVEIDGFTLVRPIIHLEVNKAGRGNWEFQEAAPAPEAMEQSGGTDVGAMLRDLRLGEFRIENGLVTYQDATTAEERQEVSAINVSASLPRYDAPFEARGDLVWKGETVELSLSTANLQSLMNGETTGIATEVNSGLLDLSLDGSARTGDSLAVDGAVKLTSPSVRKLSAWLAAPIEMPGEGLGPLAIAGQLKLRENSYGFENIDFSLDDLRAKGLLALETGGERPMLRGSLTTDSLDLNPYLPPVPEEEPEWTGWSSEPIDVSGLKAADMNLSFSTNALKVRDITIGRSNLVIALQNGVLKADLREMELYNGGGSGSFTVDGSGAVPAITADFDLKGVTAEPLLKDAAGSERLSGGLETNFNLSARGQSQQDMVAALNGKGSFAFTDGTVKGVDVAAIAGTIEQIANGMKAGGADMLKNLLSGDILGSLQSVAAIFGGKGDMDKTTKFTSLTANWTANNGIISNQDLELIGPLVNQRALFRMTGQGDIMLAATELDYTAEIRSFAKSAEGSGVGGTVKVTGDLMEPNACVVVGSLCLGNKTQPEDLVKDKLQRAIQGQGEEGSGNPLDKFKGAIDKLKGD